jgi:hypothetical protein
VTDQPPPPDLFPLLTDVGRVLHGPYPGLAVAVVGTAGDKVVLRLPCPTAPPVATAAEEGDAALILKALAESDRPPPVIEAGYQTTGREPTGAFRRALRRLVEAGRVRELPGPPRTYDLV